MYIHFISGALPAKHALTDKLNISYNPERVRNVFK